MARAVELHAFMNGERVGTLTQTGSGGLEFQYHSRWLASDRSRPISRSLPLAEQVYRGNRVIDFFDNLLPENASIRNRIQSLLGAASTETFDLLSTVGADCVGALQLLPPGSNSDARSISSRPLSESEIADRLRSVRVNPLGMHADEDFRISLAGVQAKMALLWRNDAWHLPSGPTPTTHILKLQIGQRDGEDLDLAQSVENEFFCQLILQGFDLPVAETSIVDFEDVRALAVTRFDRRWLQERAPYLVRFPQEDLCQALGLPASQKYESDGGPGMLQVMDLLLQSEAAGDDRRIFMKAQAVFYLLAATDGHAKNFSLFLRRGGRFRLTPLYDVLSVYPAANANYPRQKWKMAMAVQGRRNRHYKWNNIVGRHWLTNAKHCRFDEREMKVILEELADGTEGAIAFAEQRLPSGFPESVAERIVSGIRAARERLGGVVGR